jgi:5-methylcytosine-specific restriction endonuclease McrA
MDGPRKRRSLGRRLRLAVYARDDWTCQYCGMKFDRERTWTPTTLAPYWGDAVSGFTFLELDHVHPLYLGGSDCAENLCAACTTCNRKKSFRALESV